MTQSQGGISYRDHFLDLFLSYYLSTENPADKKRKRRDVFDDISLKNKPEKELTCRIRIRIKYELYDMVCELHFGYVYP